MKSKQKTLVLASVFVTALFLLSTFAAAVVVGPQGKCNNPPKGSCTAGTHTCVEGAGGANACIYRCGTGGTYTSPGEACSYTMCSGGDCAGEGIAIHSALAELLQISQDSIYDLLGITP
jgi:hypothetical protein